MKWFSQGHRPVGNNSPARFLHKLKAGLTLEEFKALHAGNAIRFGLHPLEFSAWQDK